MQFHKIILTTVLLTLAHSSFAGSHRSLVNYSELENALAQGDNVKAVVDFTKCSPMADTMGSMNFTTFNKYIFSDGQQAKETIATVTTVLSHTRKFGYVNNVVRLRVFKDNTAEISNDFIDPKTFVQITSSAYTCKINAGVNLYLMENV